MPRLLDHSMVTGILQMQGIKEGDKLPDIMSAHGIREILEVMQSFCIAFKLCCMQAVDDHQDGAQSVLEIRCFWGRTMFLQDERLGFKGMNNIHDEFSGLLLRNIIIGGQPNNKLIDNQSSVLNRGFHSNNHSKKPLGV